MTTPTTTPNRHTGGCHCGAVRFEAEIDASAGTMCNCSICTKLGAVGVIAKPAAFRLMSGEAELSTYEWGGRIAQRKFCKRCGVYCFAFGHLEVLGGDYVSINLNSLDDFDLSRVQLGYWDGRHDNWQAGPRATPWPVSV